MEGESTYSLVLVEYNSAFPHNNNSGDITAYGITADDGIVVKDGVVIPTGLVDKSKFSVTSSETPGRIDITIADGVELAEKYTVFIYDEQGTVLAFQDPSPIVANTRTFFLSNPFQTNETCFVVVIVYREGIDYPTDEEIASAYGVSASHGLQVTL